MQVEQALAAGAALEEFLPAECRFPPHKRLKPTPGDAGNDVAINLSRPHVDAQAHQQHCIVPEQTTSTSQVTSTNQAGLLETELCKHFA